MTVLCYCWLKTGKDRDIRKKIQKIKPASSTCSQQCNLFVQGENGTCFPSFLLPWSHHSHYFRMGPKKAIPAPHLGNVHNSGPHLLYALKGVRRRQILLLSPSLHCLTQQIKLEKNMWRYRISDLGKGKKMWWYCISNLGKKQSEISLRKAA